MVLVEFNFAPNLRTHQPVDDIIFAFFHYANKPESGIPEYETTWLKQNRLMLHFAGQCNRRLEFTKLMAASYQRRYPDRAELVIDDHPVDAIKTLASYPEYYFFPGRPKFTREQCLVALDLDYFYDFDFHILQRAIVDFQLKYLKENYPRIGFTGSTWRNHDRLQFVLTHNCDRRMELMREFADAFLLKYPDEMLIKVSEDITLCDLRIVPLGSHWIDGNSDRSCPPK